MYCTPQQEYYSEVVRNLRCIRYDQLHTLLRVKFHRPGYEDVCDRHMEAMFRQLRLGNLDLCSEDGLIFLKGQEPDPLMIEAIDVMLELSADRLPFGFQTGDDEVRILKFALEGEKLNLFSVAELIRADQPNTTERRKMERIVWISESGQMPRTLKLPKKHFFAARNPDGSHRFYGSTEP